MVSNTAIIGRTYKRGEIYDGVTEVLWNALGVDRDEITLDSKLVEDLGAESIDWLDIVFKIEKRFSIKVPFGELFPSLREEHFRDEGNINKKGMDYLERYHPHIKIDKKRSRLILADYITVESVVNYVQGKLN